MADPDPDLDLAALQRHVVAWYDEHARQLPWREPSASPWAVMVSEFMLQQTPVVAGAPGVVHLAGAVVDPRSPRSRDSR